MVNKIVFLALFIPSVLSYEETIPSLVLIREDVECMAKNIYHEARGEGLKGMQAVIEVTHNRAIQRNKTICEIVYEKKQFSWTNSKRKQVRDLEEKKQVVIDWYVSPTNHTKGSTYFHAAYVSPKWKHHFKRQTKIGKHIFYSEKS
jgi:N-acetylmuramoyl-L-alanine amidase